MEENLRVCTKCGGLEDEVEFYATSSQCKSCMKEGVAERRDARQGILYLASNPAWPNHLKIGSCKNSDTMMKTLQVQSPYGDYKLERAIELNDITPILTEIKTRFSFERGWIAASLDEVIEYFTEIRADFK